MIWPGLEFYSAFKIHTRAPTQTQTSQTWLGRLKWVFGVGLVHLIVNAVLVDNEHNSKSHMWHIWSIYDVRLWSSAHVSDMAGPWHVRQPLGEYRLYNSKNNQDSGPPLKGRKGHMSGKKNGQNQPPNHTLPFLGWSKNVRGLVAWCPSHYHFDYFDKYDLYLFFFKIFF